MEELSKCDYLISAKIYNLKTTPYNLEVDEYRNPKWRQIEYKSACKIAIIAYDLKTKKEILNFECFGYVWMNQEDEEDDKIFQIFQYSQATSDKVMKKVIKKLKHN